MEKLLYKVHRNSNESLTSLTQNANQNDWLYTDPVLVELTMYIDNLNLLLGNVESNERHTLSERIRELRGLKDRLMSTDNEAGKSLLESDIRKLLLSSNEEFSSLITKHLATQRFGLATMSYNNKTFHPFINLNVVPESIQRNLTSVSPHMDIVVLDDITKDSYNGGVFAMYNYFSSRHPTSSKAEVELEILKEQVRRKSRRRESIFDKSRSKLANINYQVVVKINDIILWIGQDAIMYFSLYDNSEDKFISEEVSVPLLNTNPVKCDGSNIIVFKDVQVASLDDIWITCKIIRIGPLKYDALKAGQYARSGSSASLDQYKPKRPYSASAMRLSDFSSSGELCMPLFQPTSEDMFHDIHQLIINESRSNLQTLSKAKGITLNVKIHKGLFKISDLKLNPGEFLLSRPLKISDDIINPNGIETRNDLYITLEEGNFGDRKNFELLVETRPREISRKQMPRIIHKSVVYYHDKEPKWYECFRINLDDFRDLDHLYITVSHVHDNGKLSDVSFAYLPLKRADKSFLPNTQKVLPCYKFQKSTDDTYYLKETLKPYKADSIKVSTNFVSTKFSENVPLMTLLNWKSNMDNISEVLSKCKIIPRKDIANFCADILEAIFGIMDFMEETVYNAFQLLMSILSTCTDDQDNLLSKQVDKYLEESFANTKTCNHIMDCLHDIFHDIESRNAQRNAALVFKNIEYILKIIIKSRQNANAKKGTPEDLSLDQDFKKELLLHINDFINVLKLPQHDLLGIQAKFFKTFPLLVHTITPIYTSSEISYMIHRVLDSFQNANQIQLNVEKLLFLETYQYSIHVGPVTLFNQLKNHMRQSVEERLHSIRILKNILLPLLNTYLTGKLDLHAPIQYSEFDFSLEETLYSPNSSIHSRYAKDSFGRSHIKVKNVDALIEESDMMLKTSNSQLSSKRRSKSRLSPFDISVFNSQISDLSESDKEEQNFEEYLYLKLNSIPKLKRKSIPVELLLDLSEKSNDSDAEEVTQKPTAKTTSLFQLLVDMLPSLSRLLRKTEEGDIELRTELGVCLLSILRIISVESLWEYIQALPYKDDKNSIVKALIDALIPLISNPTFPLSWPDLVYTLVSVSTDLIQNLLIPHVLSFDVEQMDEEELFMFSRLFKLNSTLMMHTSLNYEKHILRHTKLKLDFRHELSKCLLQLWKRFDLYHILIINESTTKILEMILSRHEGIKKLGFEIYSSLIQRDISVAIWAPDMSGKNSSHQKTNTEGSFPHVELATIHALEELSNSNNWDEVALKAFFSTSLLESLPEEFKAKEKLNIFIKDILSLISLLASLRDLPHGAEYDEERAYVLTQLMIYLRQSEHANAYLEYAYKLSKMYEESEQYVEAAFATLLHADMLEWTGKLLPQALHYPQSTEANRKKLLLEQALRLFDKGKAWEEAINISNQIITSLKTYFYDYESLSKQLHLQADLYNKIITQDRYFSNYFYVGYYGKGFPKALRGKEFIYRGLELERIPHFMQRMGKKFPQAKILTSMDPIQEEVEKNRGGQFLHIFSVKPSNEEEMEGKEPKVIDENIPERIRNYSLINNVKHFHYSVPFHRKDGEHQQNEFSTLYITNIYVTTEAAFPNVQRRLEIVQKKEITLTPIENAIRAVEMKNKELRETINKVQSGEHGVKIDRLSMALSGILDAAVNGGTAKYQEAFLTKEYSMHHKDKASQDFISHLKITLLDQLEIVSYGLYVHHDLCSTSLEGFHSHLEAQYKKMDKQMNAMIPELADKNDNRNKVVRMKDFPESRPSILQNIVPDA